MIEDQSDWLGLAIDRVERLAEGIVGLALSMPDDRQLPAWEPGAHVDVALPNGIVRQYSLCGEPEDRHSWRVAVLRDPASRGGSRYLHDEAQEGIALSVRGPRNHFPLKPADRHLFIAGGIGITPIMPMLAEAERTGSDWRLVYGGRQRASMAFASALTERYAGRVRVVPEDEAGLLPLPELLTEPQPDTLVYACGPERLLSAVELGCAHWPAGSLHVERFTPKGQEEREDTAFEVELARSGRVLTVPAPCTLLAALAEAGIEVESACEEGICGTCETTVLAGDPDHRDSVLSDEERTAGDTMFPCVSRATSARLVLDL